MFAICANGSFAILVLRVRIPIYLLSYIHANLPVCFIQTFHSVALVDQVMALLDEDSLPSPLSGSLSLVLNLRVPFATVDRATAPRTG
jgi:hypothetical protein